MQINFLKREVICKIVYYGPGMSGKTTNLQQLNEKTPVERRSNLTSIATEGERTLFFDYMPLNLGSVGDMNAKFQLYTVPGQVYYNATRKLVLQGSDGVIFVADSQKEKLEENIESLKNLVENLKEYDISIQDVPLVIQWNKRDLPNAEAVSILEKQVNIYQAPTMEAVAVIGEGVVETLKLIAALVLANLNKKQDAAVVAPAQKQITPDSQPTQPPQTSKTTPEKPIRSKTSLLQKIRGAGERCLGWMGWKEKTLAQVDDVNLNKSYMISFYNLQLRLNGKLPMEDGYESLSHAQKKEYLDQLINHYLLLEESKKLGITVSKVEVDKYLATYFNKFGSEEKGKAFFTQRKLTLEDLRNEITKQVLTNKIINIKIPNCQDEVKYDGKELLDYYNTHREKFNGSLESQKKEIEQALIKQKKARLNQKLFQILRSTSTIKTYPKNL